MSRLRSERELCEREAARCNSRAIPDPPSRKLMTVSSCSMPSNRGSDAAPTRDGSSPSSLANVYGAKRKKSYAAPKADRVKKKLEMNLPSTRSSYPQYGHPTQDRSSHRQDPHFQTPRRYSDWGLCTPGKLNARPNLGHM